MPRHARDPSPLKIDPVRLVIDGYNVLYAAGILPRANEPGELQQARQWLVRYAIEHVPTPWLPETIIVFDAKFAPSHLPDRSIEHEVRIFFARNHEEADDLIEEIIRKTATPKRLTVVTSDLRLRQAIQRRKGTSLTSETWLETMEAPRRNVMRSDAYSAGDSSSDDKGEPGMHDTETWLATFGFNPNASAPLQSGRGEQGKIPNSQPQPTQREEEPDSDLQEPFDWGPFPPGFGEDISSAANPQNAPKAPHPNRPSRTRRSDLPP